MSNSGLTVIKCPYCNAPEMFEFQLKKHTRDFHSRFIVDIASKRTKQAMPNVNFMFSMVHNAYLMSTQILTSAGPAVTCDETEYEHDINLLILKRKAQHLRRDILKRIQKYQSIVEEINGHSVEFVDADDDCFIVDEVGPSSIEPTVAEAEGDSAASLQTYNYPMLNALLSGFDDGDDAETTENDLRVELGEDATNVEESAVDIKFEF